MPRAEYRKQRAQKIMAREEQEARKVLVQDKSREARRVIAAMERQGYTLSGARYARDGDELDSASNILWEDKRERSVRRWSAVRPVWRFIWKTALWLFVLMVIWNMTE